MALPTDAGRPPGASVRIPSRLLTLRTALLTRAREWLRREGPLVIRWYFALLLTAMAAKYASTQWGYVLKIPASGSGVLAVAVHRARWIGRVIQVYRADIIEGWVIVGLLIVVLRGIARLPLRLIAWTSTSIAVVVGFACWLAVRETGVPLTYEMLLIALHWGWQNPAVVPATIPLPDVALIIIVAVAWGGAAVGSTSKWARSGWREPISRRGTGLFAAAAICLLATSLVMPGPWLPSFTASASPADGFWSAAAAALVDADRESPVNLPKLSTDSLMREYERVAYPLGIPRDTAHIASLRGPRTPRHVVVLVLETAPLAFYPLTDDSTLPTFSSMSRHALVSRQHFTTRPFTLYAIYSILSGTYPRPGPPIGEYGAFRNDGLARVLTDRGYKTSYIDSYRVDWGYRYRAELEQEGFGTILDAAELPPAPHSTDYDGAVAREHWSFRQALNQIASAKESNTKAFVVVATNLGHFPWRAPPEEAQEPSAAKLHRIARALDDGVGEFLRGLDSLGVADSTLVIVTGDHGLRYKAELDSFDGVALPHDVDFNVPFLLYAPGLIARRVELPYATSHVDIAPTVYAMLGISTDSLVLHGENMLDARLAYRAIFLMNTGGNPVDAVRFAGHRFESNLITHEVRAVPQIAAGDPLGAAWPAASAPGLLSRANHEFNLTAASFIDRARSR